MKHWRWGWAALALLSGLAVAAELRNVAAVPQLGQRGVAGYQAFLASGPHRAFAIAPGGMWAWLGDLPSTETAEQAALDACQEHTTLRCVLYASDDQVVFDAQTWPQLWGPYVTADAAKRLPVGVRRGERFPDLTFRDAAGRTTKVADFRGRVFVLHLWGSWCGPCRRELPDLQKLVRQMEKPGAVRFAFLPVREAFSTARDWAQAQQLRLPLYDSGVDGSGKNTFTLADGTQLPDRQIASKFPTTYVLDKHGVVIFVHVGDVSRWTEYAPFLQDAVKRSGK